jgi:hypothetical protein
MITISELSKSLKKLLDPEIDQILSKLFKKGLDANSFISEEVRKTFQNVCFYLSEQKIVSHLLSNSGTKATPNKLNILFCFSYLIERFDKFVFDNKEFERILQQLFLYFSDNAQEVRSLTK